MTVVAWGTVKGKGWTQVDPADGTPLSGAPFLDACPPPPRKPVAFNVGPSVRLKCPPGTTVTTTEAPGDALAQRVENARAALGLSIGPPLSDPVAREFDPPRAARPLPARVPPRADDSDPGLPLRLEAAREALNGAADPDDDARKDARALLGPMRAAHARLHADAPPTDAEAVMERARAVKEAMQSTVR